ncbi:MAG: sulfite exporter TauE/SafE family protein [Burkholderiales bacterium]|nr:sulfite exporter TauE/SafE family protein [Burkholderiales bacterium]
MLDLLPIAFDFRLPLIGFAIGAIIGLTGVGGGSLMTPILVAGLGVAPTVAVGTDLLFAAVTKSFGALAHWRLGNVARRLLLALMASSMVGAGMAFAIVQTLQPDTAALHHVIRSVLGFALVTTAVALVVRPRLMRARTSAALAVDDLDRDRSLLPTLGLGAVIGAMVMLSSVGAGAVGVTALLLLHPALPMRRIVGTDVAYAVPLTAAAGAAHASLGHVDGALLVALLIGSVPGIALGARLSRTVPEAATRTLLVGALGFAGIKLVV